MDPAEIVAGAGRYAAHVRQHVSDSKYIAQAKTWLSQKRWTESHDEPEDRRLAVGMN